MRAWAAPCTPIYPSARLQEAAPPATYMDPQYPLVKQVTGSYYDLRCTICYNLLTNMYSFPDLLKPLLPQICRPLHIGV